MVIFPHTYWHRPEKKSEENTLEPQSPHGQMVVLGRALVLFCLVASTQQFRFQDMPGAIQDAVLDYCCGDKEGTDERTACHNQVSVATGTTFRVLNSLSLGMYGKYVGETGERLGEGTFGKVDSMRCNRPDRPELALKKVCKDCHTASSRREFAIQQRATERCCTEGQPCPKVLAYTLADPTVACCMGTEGHHWLLMSKLEGTHLAADHRSTAPPDMLFQIVDQLKCLHANGIVHNDVKAQHIQVSADGKRFGLLDYGLSCMDKEGCPARAAGTRRMSKVNGDDRASTNTPGGDFFALAHTYFRMAHRRYASDSRFVSCETEPKAIAEVCAPVGFDREARQACLDPEPSKSSVCVEANKLGAR